MDKQYTNQEIKWKTESIYVDIDTGEMLNKETVIRQYKIIHKKKTSHVYKQTGTVKYTNECRTTNQLKLF